MDVNSRHAARQLLHSGAVVESEVPRRDGDAAEAERQSDRDKVCRRQDGTKDKHEEEEDGEQNNNSYITGWPEEASAKYLARLSV